MSNYTKSTNFAVKDGLPSGDTGKRVKGTEIDDEFNSISTAINSKANTNNTALTGVPTVPTASTGTNTTQIASTAFVLANTTAAAVNNLAYPIGSIYTSVSSTNPATLLGVGTWSQFAAGRTLVGVDTGQTEFDTVEETGGAKTHTLSEAEMPAHTHTYQETPAPLHDVDMFQYMVPMADPQQSATTGSTGGDQPHNNLQPYITVYFWKRTA